MNRKDLKSIDLKATDAVVRRATPAAAAAAAATATDTSSSSLDWPLVQMLLYEPPNNAARDLSYLFRSATGRGVMSLGQFVQAVFLAKSWPLPAVLTHELNHVPTAHHSQQREPHGSSAPPPSSPPSAKSTTTTTTSSFTSTAPRIADGKAASLARLFHNTSVAIPLSAPNVLDAVSSTGVFSQQEEIVLRIIGKLFRQYKTPVRREDDFGPDHLLALGFIRVRPNSSTGLRGLDSVECAHPNSAYAHVNKPAWRRALEVMGEQLMQYVLLHCFVFVDVGNRSCIQVSGPSLKSVIYGQRLTVSKLNREQQAAHFQALKQFASKKLDRESLLSSSSLSNDASIGSKRRNTRSDVSEPSSKKRKSIANESVQSPDKDSISFLGSDSDGSGEQNDVDGENNASSTRLTSRKRQRSRLFLRRDRKRRRKLSLETSVLPQPPGMSASLSSVSTNSHVAALPPASSIAQDLARRMLQPAPRVTALSSSQESTLDRLRALQLTAFRKSAVCYGGSSLKSEGPAGFHPKNDLNLLVATSNASKPSRSHLSKSARSLAYRIFDDVGSEKPLLETLVTPPPRLHRRLLASVPLLERTLDQYLRCDFQRLLNRCCPLPSAQSSPGRLSSGTPGESNASSLVSSTYESLISQASSTHSVSRFVCCVIARLVPLALFGSDYNRRSFFAHVEQFIGMRLHEKLFVRQLLQNMRLSDCTWLWSKSSTSNDISSPTDGNTHNDADPSRRVKGRPRRVTRPELYRRTLLFARFLEWVMHVLVIPLLQVNFFCTETSAQGNQTFFFRRRLWRRVHEEKLAVLLPSLFERMRTAHVKQILRRRDFSWSYVRILLKSNAGARPIVNQARKPGPAEKALLREHAYGHSINKSLIWAHEVLKWEAHQHGEELLGSTVLSPNDVYARLLRFREAAAAAAPPTTASVPSASSSFEKPHIAIRPLFFASMDAKGSYDRIDQGKLSEVLGTLLHRENYEIRRWMTVAPMSHQRIAGKWRRTIIDGRASTFEKFVKSHEPIVRNSMIVDGVTSKILTREEIHHMLYEHVMHNIVRIDGVFYKQKQGIPQGSILSSLLCCLLYAHLERCELAPRGLLHYGSNVRESKGPGGKEPSSSTVVVGETAGTTPSRDDEKHFPDIGLMMRHTDDFLYITSCLKAAESFSQAMLDGFPEYGCVANADKVKTNFPFSHGDRLFEPCSTWLAWCGYLLNTQTLEIRSDYARRSEKFLNESITAERDVHPGLSILRKLKHHLKQRLHPMFLDRRLNSDANVYMNVYQALLICAMRLHVHLKSLPRLDPENNLAYLIRLIGEMIDYIGYLVQIAKKNARKERDESEPLAIGAFDCPVTEAETSFLAFTAFNIVLSRKQSSYTEFLSWIRERLEERRQFEKKFDAVVFSPDNSDVFLIKY